MSGLPFSDWATMSRTVKDSGLRADLPVSNMTPRRMTGARSVRVERATLGVDPGPGGRARALVEAVQDSVPVLVRGAALCVYARPDGRAGALVEPVVHAVSVGVDRAASRIHRGAHWRVGTCVPLIGDSVMVGVGRGAASPREDGQAQGANDMAGPVAAGESRVGRVEATHLEAQGGSVAEKDPVADRAMHGAVGEAIGRRILEVEAGVAAEDVEQIAGGPEIQHQAGAAVGQGGGGAAGLWIGALVARVELGADAVTEEIAQPAAAADLVVQVEDLVVAGERSEGAQLELVRALRTEAGDPARERCSQDGECSHGAASPLGLALRL